jgi:UDP-glucose 4-epimerase
MGLPPTTEHNVTLRGRRILVTGGAGFIGSHLVERIAAQGPQSLSVVDNMYLGRESNLADARRLFPDIRVHIIDATDYGALGAVLAAEHVDVVFNLAVVPLPASLINPRWTVEQNVAMTTVACELQRQGFFETLIHFSSSEAYGTASYVPMDEDHRCQPSTPYAASKLASDHVALAYRETYGSDVAVLRPFNNFGPRQNSGTYAGIIPIVVGRLMRQEPIVIYGDGEQTRDFVFVRDTADAAIKMYECQETRGHVVNIASGVEVSMNQLVQELSEVMGVTSRITHEEARPGDVRRHLGATTLAQRLLGFVPSTDLRTGLTETVAWYRTASAG